MAMGALSPAVGYLAKKAADRMTTGAMDRLGDLRASAERFGASGSTKRGAKRGAIGNGAAQRSNHERRNSRVARRDPSRTRALRRSPSSCRSTIRRRDGLGATFAQ